MAFTGNAFCTSAKANFLLGVIDPITDSIKIALYNNNATLTSSTLVYIPPVNPAAPTTGEVSNSGTNYATGGKVLLGAMVSSDGASGVAWLTFNTISWLSASFIARGALIYDSSKGNLAIAVLDFGADKTVATGTFTVQMPVASSTTALIRIA